MSTPGDPQCTWSTVTFAAPPPPADLREQLEQLRDPGGCHLVLIHATRPAAPGPEYGDRDLAWLERFPLPVVFAFEGLLAGPWLPIALACDIRACDEASTIGTEGLLPGHALDRLALLRGADLLPPVTARAAFAAGLVTIMAPPGEALARAADFAAAVAARGPIAVRLAKEAIWRGLTMDLEQALRFETDLTLLLQTTKDRAEGVRAFLEKRPPHFTGE